MAKQTRQEFIQVWIDFHNNLEMMNNQEQEEFDSEYVDYVNEQFRINQVLNTADVDLSGLDNVITEEEMEVNNGL